MSEDDKQLQDELNELFVIAQSHGMTVAEYLRSEAQKLLEK